MQPMVLNEYMAWDNFELQLCYEDSVRRSATRPFTLNVVIGFAENRHN